MHDQHNKPATENNKKCIICTGVQKVRSDNVYTERKRLIKTAVGPLHPFHTFEESTIT